MERVAPKAVDGPVDAGPVIVPAAENQDFIRSGAEHIRHVPPACDFFDEGEAFSGFVHLDAVGGVPVAGYDHLSVVEGKCRAAGSLAVEDTQGPETVGGRIIFLHAPVLADSEVVGTAASEQNFAVRHPDDESVVVGIDRRNGGPSAVLKILCRPETDESVGMASEDRQFIPAQDRKTAAPRYVQVGQALRPEAGKGRGGKDGQKICDRKSHVQR